ncbi:MAG: rhomboid family intramembrane serine protease [Proteobacteria bacterium]|nr:rhomboid family intramembrane serine protease [Cystobacterineae bacterium]MCL2259184.1 rhomboid family intramembrane serine protease [Cystobacterineae bacterium]MCL2314061.1 rhomboid family intramembrane serine protease [Pseudomonadota bacterium]
MSNPTPEAFPDMPMTAPPGPPLRPPMPWVSYGYIAVCIAIFVLGTFMGLHNEWTHRFALYVPRMVEFGEWWRLFSCHFLHGNVLHIFFNMWVAQGLGRNLEITIGSWLFLWVSLVGALGTALSSMLFSPDALMVGASGVILSWAGAMLPLLARQARKSLLIWFIQISVLSLLPGISLAGHAGGALAGFVCGLALRQHSRGHRGWLLGASVAVIALCAWVLHHLAVPLTFRF